MVDVLVPKSLMVYLVSKAGMRKAVKIATFVVAWGKATEALGVEPNFREYSEFWRQSQDQTYKELRVFHEVWPKDRTPKRVWDWCRDQVEAEDRDVAVAQALTVQRKRWA